MEFRNGTMVYETQYFEDLFNAPAWWRPWVQKSARAKSTMTRSSFTRAMTSRSIKTWLASANLDTCFAGVEYLIVMCAARNAALHFVSNVLAIESSASPQGGSQ
jgi:hypothetical protein